MSAHALLNLLNELGKRDKMRGLPRQDLMWKRDKLLDKPRILSLFHNKFDNFNNTGAQILDSIYHMTLKLL